MNPDAWRAFQVVAHREALLDLVVLALRRRGQVVLAKAASSCLRALVRGGAPDGGGRTAVGLGDRSAVILATVESRLRAPVTR